MAYHLGVDLGTTFTAAAVARDGRVEPVPLGQGTTVPSLVFLDDDGGLVIGPAAQLRASTDPSRVAREFKRRVGDPVPILLGGSPVAAEHLMARVLDWVVTEVAAAEGEQPRTLAVTHPANWGSYKRELLERAVGAIPLEVDHLVPEPVAAATFYASRRALPLGTVVAVYDLGGGTFDAAVVRSEPQGFRIVGQPDGVERLGGIDFDHAVLRHVAQAAGLDLDALAPDADPAVTVAVTRLRQECVAAKEALSTETDVVIPVTLPDSYTEVRLERAELDAMIRPALDETIVALRRGIHSAGLEPVDVAAVLLVGGSSRIPLVARLVAAELGRPVAVDARPKDATSMGAALLAGHSASPTAAEPPGAVRPSPERTAPAYPPGRPQAPPTSPRLPPPAVRHRLRHRRRRLLPVAAAVGGIALVCALVGALVLQLGIGSDPGDERDEAGAGLPGSATAGGAPIDVPDPPTTRITAGLAHACALAPGKGSAAGAVTCWGDDDQGQASPPPGEVFDTIDAGSVVTCGIRFADGSEDTHEVPAGRPTCWGSDGMETASPPPSLARAFALSVGGDHGCAISAREVDPDLERSNDGIPAGPVTCWGRSDVGQTTVPDATELDGVPAPIGNEYIDISAGDQHTCGLNHVPGQSALVVCWGDDAFGQASPPGPDPGAEQRPFARLSAGFRHTCGIHTDATVTCWGDDGSGQASPPDERFRAISAGGGFTCGIRTDGTLACWGVEGMRDVPAGEFTSIAAGDLGACGIRADGSIACWGVGTAADGPPDGPQGVSMPGS